MSKADKLFWIVMTLGSMDKIAMGSLKWRVVSGIYIKMVVSLGVRTFPLMSVTVLEAKENTVELASLARMGMDLMATWSLSGG